MVELTKDTFAAEVLEAEGTVLVDFYGDGCVPCQALMPHVHAMEDVYGKDIKFTALNTTKARRLAIVPIREAVWNMMKTWRRRYIWKTIWKCWEE